MQQGPLNFTVQCRNSIAHTLRLGFDFKGARSTHFEGLYSKVKAYLSPLDIR